MTNEQAAHIQEPQIQETANEKLKQQVKQVTLSRAEREEQERARENALPFAERTTWRKRHMYRGWQLEPIEYRHEPVDGSSPFAITRSNYGYRVLNSPDLGMVDVDLNYGAGISDIHIQAQQMEAIANIEDWVAAHPEQSWRIYRTAAGLRMIRTDSPQPLDETYDAVRDAITEADKLYCDLCKEQNAFRARISPKVHRIGADYPGWSPYAYPEGFWDHSPTQEEILAYEMKAAQYKVTELLKVVGSGQVHPSLVAVLAYHDDSCRVQSTLPMEAAAASEYFPVASVAELIAFNAVLRPNGWAPDQVWEALDGSVQMDLRRLDSNSFCNRLSVSCKLLDRLYEKWTATDNYHTYDDLYTAALTKYKEEAKRYTWVSVPGEVVEGAHIDGHWQTLEETVFPCDPRYWQLDNPIMSETTSAVIRFLPSRDGQRYTETKVGVLAKHYVSNILVVHDPKHPENNGRVFLFRYGNTIQQKIKEVTDPPPEFAEMTPGDPWDMKTGANFKLRAFACAEINATMNLAKSTFDTPSEVGDDTVIGDLLTRVYALDEA